MSEKKPAVRTENRIIVLPVTPGEKLYLPGYSAGGHEPVAIKAVVHSVNAYTHFITGENFTIRAEVEELGGRIYEFSDCLIGNKFFRTEEEAIKEAERIKCETSKSHYGDGGEEDGLQRAD